MWQTEPRTILLMLNHTLAEFSSDCPRVKTGCTIAWKSHTAWKTLQVWKEGNISLSYSLFFFFFVRKTIKEARGIQNTFHGKLLKKILSWVGIIVSLEVILRHICNQLRGDHNPNSLRKGRKKLLTSFGSSIKAILYSCACGGKLERKSCSSL